MTAEDPIDGCAHCGTAQRDHVQQWAPGVGYHGWTAPDETLLNQRMWYRRTVRATTRDLRVKETP